MKQIIHENIELIMTMENNDLIYKPLNRIIFY